MLVVTTVSCRPPRIKPLEGAPAPVQQLPKGDLPEGHRKIVFKWELRDGDMSARGDGVARVASPDSVRLDLFLGGGFGGGAAVLIGDSLRAPGPDLVRKAIPPRALLWAALGRFEIPAQPDTVVRVAPRAWVINFTNPAGMVTEAMQAVLGDRVVGICDSPIALARRAATALGLDPARTRADYVGLNHLGWLRGLVHDGEDVLPRLLADPSALRGIEEGRLFGPDWVQALGALPNEYLYYYYYARDALASIRAEPATRGDYLLQQQRAFYDAVAARPARAYEEWQRVRAERDATYMAEVRSEDEARDEADVAGGGYEGVALAFMAAVMRGTATTMILNVRNGTTVAGLPRDAVVEVPCLVDAAGARALSTTPPDPHQLGLMSQVKAVEQLTIAAARSRDVGLATTAFALHPLVDSVSVARELVRGYRIADLFDRA